MSENPSGEAPPGTLDESNVARLRDRLLLAPQDAGAMLDLAAALEAAGDLPGPIDLCQRALRVDPYRPDIAARLGGLWAALGDNERARSWFDRALAIDPDCAAATAGLVALAGDAGLTEAYIRTLFDQYADRFDAELMRTLQYQAPALVAAALTRCGVEEGGSRILDLGCGTGLSGIALRSFATSLDGVDLSAGMIAKARARGRYQSLTVGDAQSFLDQAARSWDIIAAVDMLNYVGDLRPILAASARRLAQGGLIVGTLELRREGGIALTPKKRYAHGIDHLKDAANAASLVPVELSEATLRTEGGVAVAGLVFVLSDGRTKFDQKRDRTDESLLE